MCLGVQVYGFRNVIASAPFPGRRCAQAPPFNEWCLRARKCLLGGRMRAQAPSLKTQGLGKYSIPGARKRPTLLISGACARKRLIWGWVKTLARNTKECWVCITIAGAYAHTSASIRLVALARAQAPNYGE